METLVKELAVKPCGVPSAARAVETVIPVANRAQARRNRAGSKGSFMGCLTEP